jgi:hypothetical protein
MGWIRHGKHNLKSINSSSQGLPTEIYRIPDETGQKLVGLADLPPTALGKSSIVDLPRKSTTSLDTGDFRGHTGVEEAEEEGVKVHVVIA